MPFDPPPPRPTDVLVAIGWIAGIPGFTTEMVGSRLPPDTVQADGTTAPMPAPWLQTGFVTVQTAAPGLDPVLPRRSPVMQVDCWATLPGSNDPPWGMAEALGEAITVAAWQRAASVRVVIPLVNGVEYPSAVVQGAYLATGFRRLYDDVADYARITANLALSWVTPSLQIP
jgi:hypothetical protein